MYLDIIAILVLVLVLIVNFYGPFNYDTIMINGEQYHVLSEYPTSRDEAAKILSVVHDRILRFVDYERVKYRVGLTKEELQKLGPGPDPEIAGHHAKKIIEAISWSFNPEKVYENDPNNISGSTSYTVQKGREMYVCLRNKDGSFVDINTLMFVILHEISHIGAYWTFGHTDDFWTVFAFILKDAIEAGVYKYVDYSKYPVNYCGLEIKSSPYRPPN